MSTNLQLPRIQLTEIKIPVTSSYSNCTGGESSGGVEICRTPTSVENKIPEILSCPPAPRKPKSKLAARSCKRKLFGEFQFFEIANREEVESFFRSSYEQISDSSRVIAKKRCKCT